MSAVASIKKDLAESLADYVSSLSAESRALLGLALRSYGEDVSNQAAKEIASQQPFLIEPKTT